MNQSAKKDGSPFVAPAAVEAWDTWFRWRENGRLRDDTVEATWQRVAAALAVVEPATERPAFEGRLLDAFADWRLLLDERILASAGSGTMTWPDDRLVAVLNVAGFVRTAATPQDPIDLAALQDCADLAVHALDNAIVLHNASRRVAKRLRVGLVGFANALAMLGLDYAGADARALARRIARALATGCLNATTALAETRGPAVRSDAAWLKQACLRDMPTDLIDRARRYGLRHAGLTSITAQPRLARFANDVADCIQPLAPGNTAAPAAQSGAPRKTSTGTPVPAQLEMRGAMQPWMDEPIAFPLQTNGKPTPARHLEWYALAAARRLGALAW